MFFLIMLLQIGCDLYSTDPEDCSGVSDVDGNCYATVQIGEQLWTAKNLKVTHYQDRSEIPKNGDWWSLNMGAYCDYDNNPSNSDIYGRLYNWYATNDVRGLCMDGWHVPTLDEYKTLTEYLGGEDVAGGKMKEEGTKHWLSPNTGATNESGFTALPAGMRAPINNPSDYIRRGESAFYWSSSEDNGGYYGVAWYLRYNQLFLGQYDHRKDMGYSIRCVKGLVLP